ncbi:MAG: Ig-like domain-containing protein, partial [Gallionella sp.]|nr:Ig-like domain-containing protein [Gallionella sp.]
STTMMIKPAQAEGTVSAAVLYKGGTNNDGYDCTSMISAGAVQSCEMAKRQHWLERDHDNLVNYPIENARIATCSAPVLNDFGPSGSYVDHFSIAYYRNELQCGFYSCIYSACIPYNNEFYIYTALSCPAHSTATGTTTCTCDTGYVPDAAKTSCVLEQYTLSLTPESATIEPGNTYTFTATVTNQDGSPPTEDVPVTVKLEVDLISGGHEHGGSDRPKGGVSPASGNNSFTITFGATEVSGTHTITATCDMCSNSPQKATVDVKVEGLATIPASQFYTFVGATENHSDNHYLTPEAASVLWSMAASYQFESGFKLNGVAPPPLLHVNDASLVWGGVFDLDADWETPHDEHKRGTVIDIRANSNTGAIAAGNYKEFIRLAKFYKADAEIHSPEGTNQHFHVRLLGRSE